MKILFFDIDGTLIGFDGIIPEVKELADYVTASVAEDGIYKALEHFDLI